MAAPALEFYMSNELCLLIRPNYSEWVLHQQVLLCTITTKLFLYYFHYILTPFPILHCIAFVTIVFHLTLSPLITSFPISLTGLLQAW